MLKGFYSSESSILGGLNGSIAKIDLKQPILAISPLKLTFFDIKLAFKTPKI